MFTSRHVQQTFKIQVMQPLRKRGEKTRFPVVYVTDGNYTFDALKGISYSIQSYERDAPRFILVGISYPSESPVAGEFLRVRDMTFPGFPRLEMTPSSMDDVLVARPGTKDYFGAEDFQRFIGSELVPYIDDRYETLRDDRTYFGHSLGGGFGLFTLLKQPALFSKYIISSPSLVYESRKTADSQPERYEYGLSLVREFLSSGASMPQIKAYMSVGTEEEFETGGELWQLTSSFFQVTALMRAACIPGLTLTVEAFPRETHMTVWPMAFIHGIQSVFGSRTRSG